MHFNSIQKDILIYFVFLHSKHIFHNFSFIIMLNLSKMVTKSTPFYMKKKYIKISNILKLFKIFRLLKRLILAIFNFTIYIFFFK